ncbi:MAG: hypothetical protein M3077_14745, partial [Candidatus Dormibacteraeota bacterium]|nr:hypothetical protein [Candidatus Dormibacteraeota bacterium]
LGATSPPNDSNATTHLGPTAATRPSPIVQIEGQTVPTGTKFPVPPTATSKTAAVSLPVLLVVAPAAVFPDNGATIPQAVYPGNAPLQSIGGVIDVVSGGNTYHVSEGVDGFAARDPNDTWARGVGVAGESDFGVGVVGSGATDLAALGSGYISQASITDVNGANIAGPPTAPPPYNFAQVRDMNGVMWISNPAGAWRRMNTVIPINPFRIYDSRPNARPAGSVTDIQVAGVNGIPTDAIGVLGNLTALGPAADGFLTMYPQGTPLAGTNSLNYTRGISALSNHVTVGLGSTGAVSVYVSGNGSTKFLFDVVGYIQ